MSKKQELVHAYSGHWSCERDSRGKVLSYVGHFAQEDADHAYGMARFLAYSGIIDKNSRPVRGENNSLIVRVAYDRNKLTKFEQWERFADILPERAKEIEHVGQLAETNQAIAKEKKQNALRFRPLAKAQALDMIRRMHKELIEVGQDKSWMLVSTVPEVALQAATYLERSGLISNEAFKSVRKQAHHVMLGGDPMEFRICISPSDAKRFADEFIVEPAVPLSDRAIQFIVERSHPPAKGWKVAG